MKGKKGLLVVLSILLLLIVGDLCARGRWTRVARDSATLYYNTTTTKYFSGLHRLTMQSQDVAVRMYVSINDMGGDTVTSWYRYDTTGGASTDTGLAAPVEIPVPRNGIVKVEINGCTSQDTAKTVNFYLYQ